MHDIVVEVTQLSSLSLQPIIDALYYDLIKRLERGMEPIPFVVADVEEAISYFSKGRVPGHWEQAFGKHLASVIQELKRNAGPGDEVWRYKSRYIGPFAGHEGLALVRDGEVIKHYRLMDY